MDHVAACCRWLRRVFTREFWLRPSEPHVGTMFWIFFVVGVLLNLGTLGLNLYRLHISAANEDWIFFGCLLAAMVLPQVPINLFSYWWWRTDSEDRYMPVRVRASHWMLLGLVVRTYKVFQRACKAARSSGATDHHRFFLAQADLSFLRLMNVYGASAPQLVIRIFRAVGRWQAAGSAIAFSIKWYEVLFAFLTACSLALNTTSYSSASRCHRYDKQELSCASKALQVLYRICFLTSRVVALACLYHLGWVQGLIVCSVLLVVFFVWFRCMGTDFTESAPQECFFHALMAYLHIFAMFNMKDDRARYRYAFYYSTSLVCEVIIVTVFARSAMGREWLALFPLAAGAGLLFHCLEHGLFHPGGTLYQPRDETPWELACQHCEQEKKRDMILAAGNPAPGAS